MPLDVGGSLRLQRVLLGARSRQARPPAACARCAHGRGTVRSRRARGPRAARLPRPRLRRRDEPLELGARGVEALAHDDARFVGLLGPGDRVVERGTRGGEASPPRRHGPRPPKRSPPTVTHRRATGSLEHELERGATSPRRPGPRRRAAARLRLQAPGTGLRHAVGEEAARPARPGAGAGARRRSSTTSNRRAGVAVGSRSSAWRAAVGPSTTTARERVAERRGAPRASAPASISRWSTSGPTTPATSSSAAAAAASRAGVERGGERLGPRLPARGVGVGKPQGVVLGAALRLRRRARPRRAP